MNYLIFETDLGDQYLTVAGQSTKNKRLLLKTIYITKKGAGSPVGNIETNSTLPSTSETSPEASSPLSIFNIAQNEEDFNNKDKKYSKQHENNVLDKLNSNVDDKHREMFQLHIMMKMVHFMS